MDETGVFDIVKKYISLIQSDGATAHDIAITIGKIGMQRPSCADNLSNLLTADNCQKGMSLFLQHFDGGKICTLAREIGATEHLLADIKKMFSVKHAAQWITSTGEDEIRKLMVEYEFVKVTNNLLNISKNSKDGAFKSWRETLKFIGLSCESIQQKYPELNKLMTLLLKLVNFEDILPENIKTLFDELTIHSTEMHNLLSSPVDCFVEVYEPYLVGFSPEECEDIKNSITDDMFALSATKSNAVVKKAADAYRKGQVKPKKALAEARALIASCIGAQPEEIFFTSGGTESDNWAIKGLLQYGDFRDTITSQIEHHAILQACQAIERLGYPVTYLPVNQQGGVTSEALSRIITDNTKLVSVMMANNEIGTVEPIEELARIAHAHGALIHTDAVQAVGHIPIDVNALGVDLLSASAHKFNGPKGIGFLYIRRGTSIHPFADGGAQEFGMRAGTENVAAIVGMSVALKKNCDHMVEIGARLHKLEQVFLGTLQQAGIDFVRNGSENRVPGNISISIRGASGEMLLHRLDLKGIAISTGSACDSVNPQVSHVIQAIGVPNEYAEGTIRVSFGRDNQVEEARDVANAIICILNSKL